MVLSLLASLFPISLLSSLSLLCCSLLLSDLSPLPLSFYPPLLCLSPSTSCLPSLSPFAFSFLPLRRHYPAFLLLFQCLYICICLHMGAVFPALSLLNKPTVKPNPNHVSFHPK